MKPVLLMMDIENTDYELWQLLRRRVDVERHSYAEAFVRINLVNGWIANLPSSLVGRTVVVLGEEPRLALQLPKELIHPIARDGIVWRQIPYPLVNEPCAELAALLLEELYEQSRRCG